MTPSQQAASAERFPDLPSMSRDQLLLRREHLLDTCARDGIRDYNTLSDEALSELFAINRELRAKNSGPPAARASAQKRETVAKSLDDLA